MQAGTLREETETDLIELLTGEECPSCDEGTLRRGEYKDTEAVVCGRCETPAVRVW